MDRPADHGGGGMTVSVVLRTLSFPAPAKLLSLNDRMHWAPKGKLTKTWREATYWHCVDLYAHTRFVVIQKLEPAIIDIALPVRTAHKRDPHNFMPTVKAIVDGLVDAGWWPDDNSDWISVMEPVLVVGGSLVTITARARP